MTPMASRSARIGSRRSTRTKSQSLAAEFVGKIQQVPPAYSAKKITARAPMNWRAKNKPVNLEPVEVEVFEFRLMSD